MSQLDPTRTPARPAVAVSLVLLRDGDAGIEVFCIERHPDGRPGGGIISFPGGRVEVDDLEKDWHAVLARWEQRQVALDPPAHYTLSPLSRLRDVDETLALAATMPLTSIQPHLIDYDGTVAQTLPGDPDHPEHELVLAGQTRYVLRGAHRRPESAPTA